VVKGRFIETVLHQRQEEFFQHLISTTCFAKKSISSLSIIGTRRVIPTFRSWGQEEYFQPSRHSAKKSFSSLSNTCFESTWSSNVFSASVAAV
jgi:hypothetical protein